MPRRGRANLFAPHRRKKRYGCLTVLFLLMISLGVVVGLNSLANRFVKLAVQPVTLPELPRELEKFTILHLSDLNAASLGRNHEHLRQALDKESFQAVCLTGDMVGKSRNVEPLLALLEVIGGRAPVFFIAGSGDPEPLLSAPRGGSEVLAPWVREAQAGGAAYLDRPWALEEEGKRIWFCPADMFELDLDNARRAYQERVRTLKASAGPASPENGAQLRLAEYQLKTVETKIAAKARMKAGDTVVALRHRPPDPDMLAEMRASAGKAGTLLPQLYLSGQLNGGQTCLPWLGPLYLPPQDDGRGGWLPGEKGISGLSVYQGQSVYISPGLGVSSYYPLPLRLFNRPTATLIELTSRLR